MLRGWPLPDPSLSTNADPRFGTRTGPLPLSLPGVELSRLIFQDFQLYPAVILTAFVGVVRVDRPALAIADVREAIR